jgi:hypothetical protein
VKSCSSDVLFIEIDIEKLSWVPSDKQASRCRHAKSIEVTWRLKEVWMIVEICDLL